MRTLPLLVVPLLSLSSLARAGEIPRAELLMEALVRTHPDEVPTAAPPRFVLTEDRQVFVGGSSLVLTARLEKNDLKAVERAAKRVAKQKALGASVSFGPEPVQYRLLLDKGRREVVATGAPASAPSGLRDLAALVTLLEDFQHPALRLYRPDAYALRAVEGTLAGGCRTPVPELPLVEALGAPRVVASTAVRGWPTGSEPASVCADGKRYVVTLRPLLPGERP